MPSAATWVDQEMIILSEVSQKEKDFKEKDCICLSQTYIAYEIYETKTDSWMENRLMVTEMLPLWFYLGINS